MRKQCRLQAPFFQLSRAAAGGGGCLRFHIAIVGIQDGFVGTCDVQKRMGRPEIGCVAGK
ncbi:hypothetical protein JKG47_17995 [Acidithiobacillus sp. MC6.1]|nr:hypothetical protein [Acidithiobacillus sp. MC6.1]